MDTCPIWLKDRLHSEFLPLLNDPKTRTHCLRITTLLSS